jgi:hypothetical protein
MFLAGKIENVEKDNNLEKIKDSIRYILNFINYLLSTNIFPPSESHDDDKNFHDKGVSFPRSYKEAQLSMRKELANNLTKKIWKKKDYANDLAVEQNIDLLNKESLKELIEGDFNRNGFFKHSTPPFLPKNIGLAKEIFVYYKLISEDIGFLIPTLLYQRIFKNLHSLLENKEYKPILTAVPDFLIVKKGRLRGIELGRENIYHNTGKRVLMSNFSAICGIPTTEFNLFISNPKMGIFKDFGYKCNRCYRSFRICDKFIEREVDSNPSFYETDIENLNCKNFCKEKEIEKCKDSIVKTGTLKYDTSRLNKKIVHFRCLEEEEKKDNPERFPLFPIIDGLELLNEGL